MQRSSGFPVSGMLRKDETVKGEQCADTHRLETPVQLCEKIFRGPWWSPGKGKSPAASDPAGLEARRRGPSLTHPAGCQPRQSDPSLLSVSSPLGARAPERRGQESGAQAPSAPPA